MLAIHGSSNVALKRSTAMTGFRKFHLTIRILEERDPPPLPFEDIHPVEIHSLLTTTIVHKGEADTF